MINPESISDNIARVREKIHQAASSADRDGDQVRLVVVTKGHPVEMVQAVLESGMEDLGENYVEESLPKIGLHPSGENLRWHMIGHIQSRKAKAVSEHFDWVHTIDSLKLARRLDRFAGDYGRRIPFLLECNVSGEETKYGWPAWNELEWEALAREIEPILELDNIMVRGLMTIAPFFSDPEPARQYFKRLRKLQDFLSARYSNQDWSELSMGMSGDYEVAIQEGSTMVRIGTAILGKRPGR